MKVDEAVETIAKFFNDLIGAWVPGTVLAVGLGIMHWGPPGLGEASKLVDGTGAALAVAGLLFALGHLLLAAHEHLLKPAFALVPWIGRFDEVEARSRQSYKWFSDLAKAQQASPDTGLWAFNDLRNLALSVSTEAASLGRRFMFISLLCNGVGTALVIMAIDLSACVLLSPKLLHAYEQAAPWAMQVILMILAALILFKRGAVFYARAMSTPFSIAVAELKLKKQSDAPKPSS